MVSSLVKEEIKNGDREKGRIAAGACKMYIP
jgi:hypothetical protein